MDNGHSSFDEKIEAPSPVVENSSLETGEQTNAILFKPVKLLELIFVLLENLIAFRIAFKFLGASENFVAVKFVYLITEPVIKPFSDAFPWSIDVSTNSVLEGSSVAVVFLLGLVIRLIERFLFSRPRSHVSR